MQGYYDTLESALAEIDFDGEPTPSTMEELTDCLDDQGILYYVPEDVEESYHEALDEGGPVTIGGLEFWPSRILKELDPIAYRCGLIDYTDSLSEDYLVLDF